MAERLKNWILPLLFGSSVAYMIIKCYHNTDAFLLSCVFFVYTLFCFTLFELIRKVKYISGLLYVVLFLAVFSAGFTVIGNAYSSGMLPMSFDKWFYGAQTEATKVFEFSFALIFMGGFFIISILYYFTQVIYRAFGTMLIMFFPLFIYAKRLDTINVFHFAIVLLLYLAVLVHNRQMKCDKNSTIVMNKSYVACVGVFVFLVTAVTAILPQPDILAVQEKDDTFFSNLVNANAPQDFSDTSSLSGGRLSDEILFYVDTTKPMYLRRQAFDNYSYKYGWYMDEQDSMANKIPKDNENYTKNTTYMSLATMLDKTNKMSFENYYFDYPDIDFEFPDEINAVIKNEENFTPYYVQLPLYATELIDSEYNKMLHGEYKPVDGQADYIKGKGHSFDYLPTKYVPKDFISKLNYSYSDVMKALEMMMEKTTDEKELEILDDLYFDVEYTSTRFDDLPEISDELSQLAHDITSGFSTPYNKAKALEGYFEEMNFEYNVDVYPDDVDDFVFNKKKGACGQFATAMTLMARSVGLTARYVEGFVVEEKNDDGLYVVREYHSHAYVEVYINGFGWVVFEPTVAGFLDFYEEEYQKTPLDVLKEYALVIVIAVAVLLVLFLLRKQISECIFRIVILVSAPQKTVILCYNRLLKHLSERFDNDFFTKSSKEVSEWLRNSNYDADVFVNLFDKVCYGYSEISKEEKKISISEYKKLTRSIRKMKINY